MRSVRPWSSAILSSYTFLSSLQDWLYWTDEITKSVYKINHAVRADQSDIVYEVMHNLSSPHDVDVYHSLKQPQGNACWHPSSSRQYLSCDACLEVNRENNQNCSVLCCVRKLCTMIRTQMWAVLTVLWIGFYHTGPISVHRFICVYLCVFVSYCICVLVLWAWWSGPDGIEA